MLSSCLLLMPSCLKQMEMQSYRMDERLSNKVRELVAAGVVKVSDVMQHLETFVRQELFPGLDVPSTDRRFFPKRREVYNLVYRSGTLSSQLLPICEATTSILSYRLSRERPSEEEQAVRGMMELSSAQQDESQSGQ